MKTVLIVDDHADIRRLLRMTLEDQGLMLHEAENGTAALAMAHAQRPDIVLLDVMMPGGIDGLEVCRRIRSTPSLAHTQVIMLSARDSMRDRDAGLQAGADEFIAKPFSPAQIAEKVLCLGPSPVAAR